jgi:hypothetical protein
MAHALASAESAAIGVVTADTGVGATARLHRTDLSPPLVTSARVQISSPPGKNITSEGRSPLVAHIAIANIASADIINHAF